MKRKSVDFVANAGEQTTFVNDILNFASKRVGRKEVVK